VGNESVRTTPFGWRMRELRLEQGLSLERLAARVASSRSHVHEFETGKSVPRPRLVAAIDRELKAGGELMALAKEIYSDSRRYEQDGNDSRRRHAIRTLTGLAFGAAPSPLGLEALRHSVEHAIGNDRGDWDTVIAEYSRSFYETPPDTMCERLSVDLGVLMHLLSAHQEDRDLNRAAASLSMILAITLTATGQVWLACRWWGTAREAADKSGDLGLRVMTRSQQVVKGLYDGSALPRVIALADETIALAGTRICPGVAGVLAGRAQALALSGRRDDASAAVEAVARVTADMPAAALADESMFGWPEHRLRHTESFVYTEVGDTKRALVAQDRALSLYPPTHVRNRGMVQMHRAACLIRDGHVCEGLRHTAHVLDAIPAEHHHQLLYEVARRAISWVPRGERGQSGFGELRDRLATLPCR
jgi:transcriptional regulator with XRE-family HTH domain